MGKPGGRSGGKKKNAGVGVDFKRVKHKVGKKLPRAQNQTDTSFKSRTINMSEQSLAADKAGQAVTGRNLTLKELLGQCGHYSERVRRDALLGLSELLAAHPDELRRHATLVVEAASERITDGDAGVRSALRDVLRSRLLPALGGGALAPFVPLLMAHVCAAMTHLAEPIRADAMVFLELLMSARPDLVAAGFLSPVLQHFSDQLSRGNRGRSIKAGSLASLHGVVLALERFLAKAVAALAPTAAGSSSSSGGNGGGAEGSSAGGEAGEDAGCLAERQQPADGCQPTVLMWRRCQWGTAGGGAAAAGQPLAAAAAEGTGAATGAGQAGAGAAVAGDAAGAAVASALLGHLLECWSEAGPSQLAESPDLQAAQCLTAILRCCDLLLEHWGTALAGPPAARGSQAAVLLKKVAPHFPVQRPAVKLSGPLEEQLVMLNVASAQLLARFLPGGSGTGGGPAAGVGPGTAAAAAAAVGAAGAALEQPAWADRLLDWFAGVMAHGSALPASDDGIFGEAAPSAAAAAAGKQRRGGKGSGGAGDGGKAGGGDSLPGAVYQAALDGALRVLPLLPPERRQQMLGGAWQLWQRSPARGAARRRVLGFWGELLWDPAAAFYLPVPGGGPLVQHAEAAAWVAALPRYLFELGSSSPAASQAALRLLVRAASCAPAGSPLAGALQELQPQLAPLFAVLLQQQGGAAAAKVHLGPLAALPPAVQELAVDLLYHFPAASDQPLRSAALVCLGDAYPATTATRLLDVLAAKAAAGAADPAAFCGLLLNVLSGSSAAGLRQRSWGRHEALVGAACRAAVGLGPPAQVGEALLPPLLAIAEGADASSSWAAFGLLQLACALPQAAAASPGPPRWQLPEAVAAALLRIILRLLASCQAGQAGQQQAGGSAGAGGVQLSSQDAAALALRLLAAQPQLLPLLLADVARLPAAADGSGLLAVAVQLLLALLREPTLRAAVLEEGQGMRSALAACRAAAEAAGGATPATRACQEQLRQADALCSAVLGE